MKSFLLKAGIGAGIVLAAVIWHHLDRAAAVDEGREAARAETLKKGVELVQERDKLNVQVRNATASDICARLGGHTDENGDCI